MPNLKLNSGSPWRLLPAVLGIAYTVRVAVVLSGNFIYHYDVIGQYYEPAWR